MQEPPFPRDETGIPTLTDIIDLPMPVPAARVADDDGDFDALRAAILQDVRARLEPVLRERMQRQVDEAVSAALASVAAGLDEALGQMVDEALHKEMIRRAARDEVLRARTRDGGETG